MTYDEIGNATSIGDKHYTWTNGRQLAQFEDENFRIEYTYNADGLRTSKTLYGKDTDEQTQETTEYLSSSYDYIWKDGLLDSASYVAYVRETGAVKNTAVIKYLYDDQKTPIGLNFTDPNGENGTLNAWYVKNLQGDVTSVYVDGYGVGIRYAYDAWGNVQYLAGNVTGLEGVLLFIVLAAYNPITYRGYSFDVESNTYYLQSRYYDPQIGRFLNQDDSDYINSGESLVASNLFAYCGNNPIMHVDFLGTGPGNSYSSILDAVYNFADYIMKTSLTEQKEYATIIYGPIVIRDPRVLFPPKPTYYYSKPIKGTKTGASIKTEYDKIDKKKYVVVAMVHTHCFTGYYNGKNYDGYSFSAEDINASLTTYKINSYLITPKGKIMVFYYATKKPEVLKRETYHLKKYMGIFHIKCKYCV